MESEKKDELSLAQTEVLHTKKVEISGYIIIPIWIGLSSCLILYNRKILTTEEWNFPYPIFLATFHMLFATILTRLLRFGGSSLLTHVKPISWDIWSKTILPIGILFSASLTLSNTAYLHLSIPFVQLIEVSHLFTINIIYIILD